MRLFPRGGGGVYSDFFLLHRLGPSICLVPPKNTWPDRLPQNNIRDFKHTLKILEVLAKPKKNHRKIPCPLCLMTVVVCARVNFITEHKLQKLNP